MSSIENALPGVPYVESPLFEAIFRTKDVTPETLDVARKLRRDGFAVIDFPDPNFSRMADTIIKALDSRYDWEGWRKGTNKNLRVQDAWQSVPEVKQIACNPTVLRLLSDLYGKRPFPFQTLNFPVGTQQHFHTDSVHFNSCPERFMAGVWVALEDIDANNGPLLYYPGSHALPVFTNEHLGRNPEWGAPNPYTQYPAYEKAWEAIVESLELKPVQFHAKKGQALIWAANLLHGGAAQNDLTRTRYSQVTHYYFEGCSYYTPLGTVPFLGKILHRDIVDISTGQAIPNVINGQAVPKESAEAKLKPEPPAPDTAKPKKLPNGFDAAAYLAANPDVRAAKADPGKHWLEFGWREGRPLR
jgi:hypothetical protein